VLSSYWLLTLGVATALVLAIAAIYLWRRRRRPSVARALRSVGVQALHDILVPNGMGGQIHIAHLLLTARGLVVLDVKAYRGTVFASDRMDEWAVIGERRFSFPNPQHALYDRVAAVRQLVSDVPVAGHILFEQGADFSRGGRPRDVLLPADLEDLYKKPSAIELERVVGAFAAHWEKIKQAVDYGL
jgi:LPXTG-motif cell wall-anchored protein